MPSTERDTLIAALHNLYALEGHAISTLESVQSRLEDYPLLRDGVSQHLSETRRQQEMVEDCLHELGEEPSAVREMAMRAMGTVQAMMNAATGAVSGDEVLKYHFALYAFEHYEIAAYRSTIAMAETCGVAAVARVCREILAQEQATAEKLGRMIEEVTRTYTKRASADLAAANR